MTVPFCQPDLPGGRVSARPPGGTARSIEARDFDAKRLFDFHSQILPRHAAPHAGSRRKKSRPASAAAAGTPPRIRPLSCCCRFIVSTTPAAW